MDDEIAMIVLALSLDKKPVIPVPANPILQSHEADIRAGEVWDLSRPSLSEPHPFHPIFTRQPRYD